MDQLKVSGIIKCTHNQYTVVECEVCKQGQISISKLTKTVFMRAGKLQLLLFNQSGDILHGATYR